MSENCRRCGRVTDTSEGAYDIGTLVWGEKVVSGFTCNRCKDACKNMYRSGTLLCAEFLCFNTRNDGTDHCATHYQPNNPASPVGTPDALKTSQED